MHRLIIRHMPGEGDPQFVVMEATDLLDAEPVVLSSPVDYEVQGQPESGLLSEIRWYLEKFLDYPFPPRTERAERVNEALRQWGQESFKLLFNSGQARDFYRDATEDGMENLCLEVRSDDPGILAWPWEALESGGEHGPLALGCQLERRLTKLGRPTRLSDNLPTDRINILLVIARPYEGDVAYRSISRPLVELIEKDKLPVEVTVLRPPTFERLQEVLNEQPDTFHILHFDGHGGYGSPSNEATPYQLQGPVGKLIFENADGEPDPVDAETLSVILRQHKLPAVVLNACQSGMVDQDAEDAFASVAAALLKGGVRSVVAMAYSLYVSGAREFLPAFYKELFNSGELGKAALAGRRKMFENPDRVCAVGTYKLSDWLVPVVYQQAQLELTFEETQTKTQSKSELPDDALDKNPYGFIGRDSAVLALERALRRKPAGILIHGLGGVGKTTLAKGFLNWLAQTGGTGAGVLWISFQDARSAEYVVNQMVAPLFGVDALAGKIKDKVAALTQALHQNKLIIVWDNFESARGIERSSIAGLMPSEDQGVLKEILEGLRGGQSKVLITSRGEEAWLGASNRFKLTIGGLHGEERWEFCDRILDDLGKTANRKDEQLVTLMDTLGGHPLMMRAVLPMLESKSAQQILDAIQSNLAELDTGDDELKRVMATLRFVQDSLPEATQPLLMPLGLHERYVDADDLEAMGKAVDGEWSQAVVGRFVSALEVAGLLSPRGQSIYELHPALTGYLRSTRAEQSLIEAWERAFVDRMGRTADHYARKELHEQRGVFQIHEANFHHALSMAGRLGMDANLSALTQSLAAYAQNIRSFAEAERLYQELADYCNNTGDQKGVAGAYHQLGMVAEERRDFEQAEQWYLKSLAISEKLRNEQIAAQSYHQLGIVAQERREYQQAEQWYLKSLAITKKQGNEHDAATTYHQLGMLAQERREFEQAEQWYLKSLAIEEKQGNEHGTAISYQQLGRVAQERREFEQAEQWYLKSLAIKEKQGNEHGAAISYHQLGIVAEERREFEQAEQWCLKALAIDEKQGNEHGAAGSYHQLGIVAQERREFEQAEQWYLKALSIKEKQGNEHGAASTYGQLGIVAFLREDFETSASWFIRCIQLFVRCKDQYGAQRNTQNFLLNLKNAPESLKPRLKKMWQESGLPPLPSE